MLKGSFGKVTSLVWVEECNLRQNTANFWILTLKRPLFRMWRHKLTKGQSSCYFRTEMLLCSYWRLIWVKEGFQGDVEQWHRNLNLGPNIFSSNFLVNLFLNSIEAAAFSLKFLRNTSPHTFRDVETAHDTWSATFDWQNFPRFFAAFVILSTYRSLFSASSLSSLTLTQSCCHFEIEIANFFSF